MCLCEILQAKPLLKDKNYPRLLDPTIGDSHDVHQHFWIVRVAERCLKKKPLKRLPMDKVVSFYSYWKLNIFHKTKEC